MIIGKLLNLIKLFEYHVNFDVNYDVVSFPHDVIKENVEISGDPSDFSLAFIMINNIILVLPVILIDMYLLFIIRKQNKKKLKLLNNLPKNNKTIVECSKREQRIRHIIIFNFVFMVIIKIPEIVAIQLHISKFNSENMPVYYCRMFDCSFFSEMFDFTFVLNSILQFFLFYLFNRNFRDSFKDIFLSKKNLKSVENHKVN